VVRVPLVVRREVPGGTQKKGRIPFCFKKLTFFAENIGFWQYFLLYNTWEGLTSWKF
jgi:hypothetical protein